MKESHRMTSNHVPSLPAAGGVTPRQDHPATPSVPHGPDHGTGGSPGADVLRADMTPDAALARLEALRGELDAVDGRLRETLRDRLDCCVRIGQLKRDSAIPMMQPQRIGIVQQRAAAFAAEHGMSPSFLRALYELIIAETCRIEDEIIAAKQMSA